MIKIKSITLDQWYKGIVAICLPIITLTLIFAVFGKGIKTDSSIGGTVDIQSSHQYPINVGIVDFDDAVQVKNYSSKYGQEDFKIDVSK